MPGRPLGQYVSGGFNMALQKAHEDITKVGLTKTLDSVQTIMEQKVKALKDQPSKYEAIYNQTIDCYGLSTELLSLARSPKESLLTYAAKCNEVKSKLAATMKEVSIRLPE